MNANNLQSMIALNATRIANTEILIGSALDEALNEKAKGNISISIDTYKHANRLIRKVAKAVALQRAMKTELEAIFRVAKIEAKTKYLLDKVGFVFKADDGATSHETLYAVLAVIDLLVPKKADSRWLK